MNELCGCGDPAEGCVVVDIFITVEGQTVSSTREIPCCELCSQIIVKNLREEEDDEA